MIKGHRACKEKLEQQVLLDQLDRLVHRVQLEIVEIQVRLDLKDRLVHEDSSQDLQDHKVTHSLLCYVVDLVYTAAAENT